MQKPHSRPHRLRFTFALAISVFITPAVFAQNTRYYEQNGVTYKETVETVQRPVPKTTWQQREQTTYRPELQTSYRDTMKFYSTPVTKMEWITRMHGRFNPFVTPYFTHHLVPVTRWENRAEVVPVPMAQTNWVPHKRVVSVPVTEWQVAEEQVTRRVAVGPAASPSNRIVSRPGQPVSQVGGIALQGDPPRRGPSAPTGTVRR